MAYDSIIVPLAPRLAEKQPISLLTAMLQCPGTIHPKTEDSLQSASSSLTPSQASSADTDGPVSILRRESVSSGSDGKSDTSATRHEPDRTLKFEMAPKHMTQSGPISAADLRNATQDRVMDEDSSSDLSDDEHAARLISPQPMYRFPFARATNWQQRRASLPAIDPLEHDLPRRRSIQLVDPPMANKHCSRHCSPPPTRVRSSSISRGRAHPSTLATLPIVSDDEGNESASIRGEYARKPRRASEHLPRLRPLLSGTTCADSVALTCDPALDDTPATATSFASGAAGLAHLLETTLAA